MEIIKYDFFQADIKKSYVSVVRTPYFTEYSIDGEFSLTLTVEYSHRTANNVFMRYTLMSGDEFIATATRGMFPPKPGTRKNTNDKTADRLEALLRQCAAKVIYQEMQAMKNNMVATIMSDDIQMN